MFSAQSGTDAVHTVHYSLRSSKVLGTEHISTSNSGEVTACQNLAAQGCEKRLLCDLRTVVHGTKEAVRDNEIN